MGDEDLDYRLLFEESPEVLLVLLPDAPRFTMVAATRARLAATHSTREQTIGAGIFELFPDNPDDEGATGARNLRASLERVIATRAADTMAVQKYDIRMPDGAFAVKYWSPKNIPVLSPSGEVRYILHRVEDVTDLVRASELGEELRDRTREMEREVLARSRELSTALTELRSANAKLGELDAAKTAFFSNVSHELRTPLTLMLGPVEDALADTAAPLAGAQRERVVLAHDNALRMLKLVNALLDFSRLEAGRLRATFEPVDLAKLTSELTTMFSSAFERAGVALSIECPALSEPVFVDRDMWEKIVPNLVSNAFKFTLRGHVAVRLSETASHALLEVEDSGIGIPALELPRVFERFHRVAGAAGRTHEGAGIGLSLVRELVTLHGGRVEVSSTLGLGTTFRVWIPKGSTHLPEGSIREARGALAPSEGATAHALEASRWAPRALSSPAGSLPPPEPARATRERVLVVDDNADLRAYVASLLAPSYEVSTARDGAEALEIARACAPDIVVSDVMMPRLDGLGLVRALRADPATRTLPVILLSARAGEESAVEGLDVGADDYLVKPFAARELLARVRTHVAMSRAREDLIRQLESANRELDAFGYSVSHDLRAPLRAIAGFTRALEEDCASSLDERGRDYLGRIASGSARMGQLIDDLLALSQVGRARLARLEIDLSGLAESVVSELRRAEPGREVSVEIAPRLRVNGDPGLVRIVMVNLLGNAWKFTRRNVGPATIRFGRAPAASEPTFYVEDDGAGFDPAAAARLFTPFSRLHRQAEFEGTGIGLATVKRAIERHGGRVWADAAEGRGATFSFTLPPPLVRDA